MDKKMHKVTKKIQTALGEIKRNEKGKAEKVLSKAASDNEKLVKYDKKVRDPLIEKCKKK